jgi:hypothetical protein
MGLMCAAICWMLYAWVPPRWALIGGLFSVMHPFMGFGGDWAQSYWGGALAANRRRIGAWRIRSLIKEPQIHRALLTGAGLTILANSRPYEGLLLSVCAGLTLVVGFIHKRDIEKRVLVGKVILPLLFTCTAIGAGYRAKLLFHCASVTVMGAADEAQRKTTRYPHKPSARVSWRIWNSSRETSCVGALRSRAVRRSRMGLQRG